MNKLINLNIRNRTYKDRHRSYMSLYPTFGRLFELADKFACENGIFGLDYKCKTWESINREALKAAKAAIESAIGHTAKVVYRKTLGCSCGCSPGFAVYTGETKHRNTDAYGFIYIDLETAEAFEKKLNTFYQAMFDTEQKQHSETQLQLSI